MLIPTRDFRLQANQGALGGGEVAHNLAEVEALVPGLPGVAVALHLRLLRRSQKHDDACFGGK